MLEQKCCLLRPVTKIFMFYGSQLLISFDEKKVCFDLKTTELVLLCEHQFSKRMQLEPVNKESTTVLPS